VVEAFHAGDHFGVTRERSVDEGKRICGPVNVYPGRVDRQLSRTRVEHGIPWAGDGTDTFRDPRSIRGLGRSVLGREDQADKGHRAGNRNDGRSQRSS
jgi:hypothetical protein